MRTARIQAITTVRPVEGNYTRYVTRDGQTFTGYRAAFGIADHHYASDEAAFNAAEAHAESLDKEAESKCLP